MSRQNKVNPGMYTQRGRLTQDDAARELKRQRVIGSPHTWQPVQRDQMPQLTAAPADDDNEEDAEKTPASVAKAPARARTTKSAAAKSAKPARQSAKPASRRPAKTAARKTAGAKKATTATKRIKAKSAKPARVAKPKAKTPKRRYKS